MIQHVYQPKRSGKPRPFSQENYLGKFKLPGDAKVTVVSLGTSDKRIAEERLKQIVLDRQREDLGILPARPLREGAQRPLLEHLADFIADLKARKRDSMYIYNIESG